MNKKAQIFSEMLKEKELECFQAEELQDELHTVIFRSIMEVGEQKLPIAVILDESVYSLIGVRVAEGLVKEKNKAQVLMYINELNLRLKAVKYSVDTNGDLVLHVCVCGGEETFEGEMIRTLLDLALRHLTEEYPKLMKKIWA